MKRIEPLRALTVLVLILGVLLLTGRSVAQTATAPAAVPGSSSFLPGPAERDPGHPRAHLRRIRLHQTGGHDPDARRGQTAHGDPGAQGRRGRAHAADPHALRRHGADDSRSKLAPRPGPRRLRQRLRCDRRRRLHPRRPGRARQVRLGGRLRDEPPAPRAAEPDPGRPRHRHLGHHRLAGQERPGVERQGRHPRHLLRRLPDPDGARQSAPGAQGGGADEPDGRRLDGRRLVPLRRLSSAEHAVYVRSGGDPEERSEVVDELLRRLRHLHDGRVRRRARPQPRARADRVLAEDPGPSELRRVLARPGGGQGAGRASR